MAQIELHQSQPQTPYIPSVAVVIASVRLGIEPLRAHVRAGSDVGITRVQRPTHDFADSEIGYLDFHVSVDEEIRWLNVSVDDLVRVKIIEAIENLSGDVSEFGFRESAVGLENRLEGSEIHVLHEDGDVAGGLLEHSMAVDDVRGVCAAEDLHLAEKLSADGGVGVAMDELKGVCQGGLLVADFVDDSSVAVPEDVEFFDVCRGDVGGRSREPVVVVVAVVVGVGSGGGRREGEREARAALGDFRQRKAEIELSATTDNGHEIGNGERVC